MRFRHFQCFLWVEFQITLDNFSGIRGEFWDLCNIKHDYLTLGCFMLSVLSEPIFKKKAKIIVLKIPKNAKNPFKDRIRITHKFLLYNTRKYKLHGYLLCIVLYRVTQKSTPV